MLGPLYTLRVQITVFTFLDLHSLARNYNGKLDIFNKFVRELE
jgi:hypothetical protein